MLHLKKPELAAEESDRQVRAAVESMLDDIERRGESAIREFAKKFDHRNGISRYTIKPKVKAWLRIPPA